MEHEIYLKIRAIGYTGHGIENHRANVDASNEVRLYDPIMGGFTKCHNLSQTATKKLIRAAKLVRKHKIKTATNILSAWWADQIIDGWCTDHYNYKLGI